jgi:hypothetical protein
MTAIVMGLCFVKTNPHHENTMPKTNQTLAASPSDEAEDAALSGDTKAESNTTPSFWLLKTATARKLGKRAEGCISYQVLADIDRLNLFIALTGNENGGYFSRERVPFQRIEETLASLPKKSFPSKTLRDVFVGRSSNNPGFLAAILSAEGLIAADATAETLHKAIGDWTAWKEGMLAQSGTLLEAEIPQVISKSDSSDSTPEHTKEAISKETAPPKGRKQAKRTAEVSDASDTQHE